MNVARLSVTPDVFCSAAIPRSGAILGLLGLLQRGDAINGAATQNLGDGGPVRKVHICGATESKPRWDSAPRSLAGQYRFPVTRFDQLHVVRPSTNRSTMEVTLDQYDTMILALQSYWREVTVTFV